MIIVVLYFNDYLKLKKFLIPVFFTAVISINYTIDCAVKTLGKWRVINGFCSGCNTMPDIFYKVALQGRLLT